MIKSKYPMNELVESLTKGIAVYETIRTYDGKPFAFVEHYNRLCKSLSYLKIVPPTLKDFESLVYDNLSDRIRIVYAYSGRLFEYVLTEESDDFKVDYVKIDFTNVRRADPKTMPPDLKSIGRPDIYLARLTKGDNYDVLMFGNHGQVCEGTFSNVFLLKNGVIVTPSLNSGILDGITRMHVIKFFREKGLTVEERFVEPQEVFYADEVFLTHTSRGIVPVNQIGSIKTRSTELSRALSQQFEDYVKWLL
ncbi:MAG TPA: aminotransferase class IV [Fervidobacterium sp.]|nr:aminotransferase class IV [Fervidobacterium sp.]HPP18270.1 aminotransferase class IV [Fervidobacterium sp.]